MTYDSSWNLTEIKIEQDGNVIGTYSKGATSWSYVDAHGLKKEVPDMSVLADGSLSENGTYYSHITRPDQVQFESKNDGKWHVVNATPETTATLRHELEQSLQTYAKEPMSQKNFQAWFDKIDRDRAGIDETGMAEIYYQMAERLKSGNPADSNWMLEFEQFVANKTALTVRVPSSGPIESANASPAFVSQVTSAYNEIPANIRQFVEAKGMKVVAAGNIYDFNPSSNYTSMHPIGWEDNATMVNPAGFGPSTAGISNYIAENVRYLKAGNQWGASVDRLRSCL